MWWVYQRRRQGTGRVELAFNKDLGGRAGSRRVIKDRMGRVVEDVGEQIAPVDGRDLQLSIDSKVQFFAYQKLKDAVLAHKAKAGSVVVLDVLSVRCWHWPITPVMCLANGKTSVASSCAIGP
jgi:cell division protein FtsI/penicillin-binding protein 2